MADNPSSGAFRNRTFSAEESSGLLQAIAPSGRFAPDPTTETLTITAPAPPRHGGLVRFGYTMAGLAIISSIVLAAAAWAISWQMHRTSGPLAKQNFARTLLDVQMAPPADVAVSDGEAMQGEPDAEEESPHTGARDDADDEAVARGLRLSTAEQAVQRRRQQLLATWHRLSATWPDADLWLIDTEGRIAHDTSAQEPQTGQLASRFPLPESRPMGPVTVGELITAEADYVGPVKTLHGPRRIAAAYDPAARALVAVYFAPTPLLRAFDRSSLPWVISFAVVGLLLWPVSITLLHTAFRRSHRDAERNLAAYKESHLILRDVLDCQGARITLLDQSGAVVAVNRAWAHFMQGHVPKAPDAFIGMNYLELWEDPRLLPGAVPPDFIEGVRSVISGQKPQYRAELQLPGMNRAVWFLVNVTSPGNPLLGAVITHEDITEQKLIERALRESESRFRALLHGVPDPIFRVDQQGRCLDSTAADNSVTLYHPTEMLGRRLRDVLPSEPASLLMSRLQRALETGYVQTVECTISRHGQQRELEARLIASANYEAMMIVRDITERKAAERALRASEQLLQCTLDSLAPNVALLDGEGRISAVNRAWRQLSTAGEAMVSGQVGDNYVSLCEQATGRGADEAWKAAEAIGRILGGTDQSYRTQYVTHKRGSEHWYTMTVLPLYDRRPGAVVVHQDVTDQVQAEHEARQRRDELAHIARVTSLGEMAAGVAHELNQPLAAIVNYARGSIRRLRNGNLGTDQLTDVLEQISSQGERAGEIIRWIRQFLRKQEAQPMPVDLSQSVRDVIRLFGMEPRLAELDLTLELATDLPPVLADPVQIQQVIFNLLSNAIDAMSGTPQGDRRLLVRSVRRTEPLPEYCDCGPWAELIVADSGPGISDANAERVFDAFFTSKASGLGMGLAISRTIVETHHGHIWVERSEWQGAAFHLILPATPSAAPQARG